MVSRKGYTLYTKGRKRDVGQIILQRGALRLERVRPERKGWIQTGGGGVADSRSKLRKREHKRVARQRTFNRREKNAYGCTLRGGGSLQSRREGNPPHK